MSTVSDKARHRCTNPRCDAGLPSKRLGPDGKPRNLRARVAGPNRWCRTCRMVAAVKRNAYNAAQRVAQTDETFRPATSADSDLVP